MSDNALAVAPTADPTPDPAQTVTEANSSPGTSTEPAGAPSATPVAAIEEAPKPPQSRREQRIEELLVERRAAVEWGKAQADLAERYKAELAAKTTPAAPNASAPKLADFKDADEWAAKFAEHTEARAAERAVAQLREESAKQATRTTAETQQAQFAAREVEAAKRYADYREVAHDERIPITQAMAEVITASNKGPDIAYYLGSHPERAAQIAALSPAQQAAALGRLEAEIKPPTPAAPKPSVTKAPEPPSPISAGGSSGEIDLTKCPIEDYMKAERRRLAARRGARS